MVQTSVVPEIRMLTVRQPWAEMIARGEKLIENRTRPTNYRGLIAIHASKSQAECNFDVIRRYPNMAFGAIIAVAELTSSVHVDWLPIEILKKDAPDGPYCWRLKDLKRMESPIPYRGSLGLTKLPTEIVLQIMDQLENVKC